MKIGSRRDEYLTFNKLQDELEANCSALVEKAKKILDVTQIDDHQALYTTGLEYIQNEFFNRFGANEPPHIDKLRFMLSKFDVDTVEINRLTTTINNLLKKFYKHPPVLSSTGVSVGFVEADFDLILDENKRPEYEALTAFLDAARTLTDSFNAGAKINLVRFHNGIVMNDNSLYPAIDPYRFAQR